MWQKKLKRGQFQKMHVTKQYKILKHENVQLGESGIVENRTIPKEANCRKNRKYEN